MVYKQARLLEVGDTIALVGQTQRINDNGTYGMWMQRVGTITNVAHMYIDDSRLAVAIDGHVPATRINFIDDMEDKHSVVVPANQMIRIA